MTDLIAGRVPCMFDASSVVAPFLKSGQLKALMSTGAKRVPAFPDVPTATEKGIKDFQVISFIGLYGPPGLNADIVKKVNTAMNSALKDPNVQKTISDRGDDAGGGTPEQLGAADAGLLQAAGRGRQGQRHPRRVRRSVRPSQAKSARRCRAAEGRVPRHPPITATTVAA